MVTVLRTRSQVMQYQMYDYQKRLKKKGIRQRMSRKGNCLDNSVMENFFGLLKSELLYLQEFVSVDHFKKEFIEYLSWYNEKRIKVKLKGLTPLQFRNQSLKSAQLKCLIIGVHFTEALAGYFFIRLPFFRLQDC